MNTSITPKELEEIYCDYDFRYFLIKNIESEQNKVEGYTISQLKEIIKSYKRTKTELQGQIKKNQTQAIKLIENTLILCHRGNSLPEHFRMTRNAGFHILDFVQYGQIWAHFEVWQSTIKGKKEPSQLRNVPFSFKNTFDEVETQKIHNHFKVGLVDSKMLSSEELREFLKAAFEKRQPPEKLFSLKNVLPKHKVIRIFYTYYKKCSS